jgi:hypothetical protein
MASRRPVSLTEAETLAYTLEGHAERVADLVGVLPALEEHAIECQGPAQAAVIRGALLRDLMRASQRLLPHTRRIHERLVALCRSETG